MNVERVAPCTAPSALRRRSRSGLGRLSRPHLRPALVVAAAYLAAGTLWIVAGDFVIALFVEERSALAQTVRALGFVLATSVALYLVLGRMVGAIEDGARTQASQATRLRDHAEQQRLLAHRLLRAEEDTRRAVAKDLHDGPLQSLTLSFMRLDAASRGDGAIDAEQVATAMTAICEASDEIRAVVRALHPPLLAELGLAAALERHCHEIAARTGREVRIDTSGDRLEPVSPDIAIAAFRITQEAVANALKHTSGDPIRVRLAIQDTHIVAEVIDQGPGFNPEARMGQGLGLLSMRERAESVGGSLTIRSTAQGGTHVRMSAPREAGRPA